MSFAGTMVAHLIGGRERRKGNTWQQDQADAKAYLQDVTTRISELERASG